MVKKRVIVGGITKWIEEGKTTHEIFKNQHEATLPSKYKQKIQKKWEKKLGRPVRMEKIETDLAIIDGIESFRGRDNVRLTELVERIDELSGRSISRTRVTEFICDSLDEIEYMKLEQSVSKIKPYRMFLMHQRIKEKYRGIYY